MEGTKNNRKHKNMVKYLPLPLEISKLFDGRSKKYNTI